MTEMKWTINNSNVSNDTDEIDGLQNAEPNSEIALNGQQS